MKRRILIIDHDFKSINSLNNCFCKQYDCISAESGKHGIRLLQTKFPDVILLDSSLNNGESGIDILREIRSIDEQIPVIIITDNSSVKTAVEAIKLGAENYISKTPNLDELKIIIENTLNSKLSKQKTIALKEEVEKPFYNIVGSSNAIKSIKEQITLVAKNISTVLITGESGTGKELVARQIHLNSNRAKEIFVAVNCGAIPVSLVESELFGHERGSFTGAVAKQLGKFEVATNGTLFLDEISELSLDAQVKIMRVLQEKEFERVGGNKTIKTNARVIAATNKNIKKLVDEGKFREDLFYRLDVFPIEVPPLRERRDDIPELAEYFVGNICAELKLKQPQISQEAMKLLKSYDWPGNIRELINYLTRAIILSPGEEITLDIISKPLLNINDNRKSLPDNISLKWEEMDKIRKQAADNASRKVEAEFAKKLLEKFEGNVSKAAEYAGINRTNLHKLIKRAGL